MIRFSQIYGKLPKETIAFQINWMDSSYSDGTTTHPAKENAITITCSKKQLCAKHVDGYLFGLTDMVVRKITVHEGKLGVVLWTNNHPFLHFSGFEEHGSEEQLEKVDPYNLKMGDLLKEEILDKDIPMSYTGFKPDGTAFENEFTSSGIVTLPFSHYGFNVTSIEIGSLRDPIKKSASLKDEAFFICAMYPSLAIGVR